jgi:hypothetical protein
LVTLKGPFGRIGSITRGSRAAVETAAARGIRVERNFIVNLRNVKSRYYCDNGGNDDDDDDDDDELRSKNSI